MLSLRAMVWPTALASAVFLVACGGDSGTDPSGGGSGGGGGGGGDSRVILSDPSFGTNIQEIFERRGCAGSACHGAARQAGMDLRAGSSYANLVNVQATSEAKIRVIPNDAQNSYIVIKLEGRQSVGERMPRGATALDNIDLTNIRNWIDRGAANN
jgi:hypothetical protein